MEMASALQVADESDFISAPLHDCKSSVKGYLIFSTGICFTYRNISPWLLRENGLFINLNNRKSYKIISLLALRSRQQVAINLMYATAGEAISIFTNCRDCFSRRNNLFILILIRAGSQRRRKSLKYLLSFFECNS